jgi:hypothetical protein
VDGPGAKLEASSKAPEPVVAVPAKAKPPSVQSAARLLAAGKTDEAVQLLYLVRRRAPKSAEVALLLGHAYFRKLWRSDGLREYDTAVQLRPGARREFLVQRNAVAALESNVHRLARAFIKNRLGVAAVPELRRAARLGKSPLLQRRASRLADQLSRRRRR